jgi:SAM-dependent methyltransferase
MKQLTDTSDAADEYSFGERFRAWWDGYELGAKARSPKPGASGAQSDNDNQESEPDDADDAYAAGGADRYPPLDRSSPWPATRREIAELVWGDGFVVPGGEETITDLVQAFGLDSSSNMLEIGAGAGGSTRAIATKFGAYVAGFDLEPELCAAAMDQAKVHSLDQKAAVRFLDLEKFEFKSEFYAAALIHDSLYRIPDKNAFLQKVMASLKPKGQLVIVDLFFPDDAAASEMDRWRDGERSEAYGWQIEEAQAVLGKHSIEVRGTSDDSDAYCAKIRDTWQEFVKRVDDRSVPDELILPMVDEAEFWARRVAAIQTGDLRFCRITGVKSGSVE